MEKLFNFVSLPCDAIEFYVHSQYITDTILTEIYKLTRQ